jgi:hypothetical protein
MGRPITEEDIEFMKTLNLQNVYQHCVWITMSLCCGYLLYTYIPPVIQYESLPSL